MFFVNFVVYDYMNRKWWSWGQIVQLRCSSITKSFALNYFINWVLKMQDILTNYNINFTRKIFAFRWIDRNIKTQHFIHKILKFNKILNSKKHVEGNGVFLLIQKKT